MKNGYPLKQPGQPLPQNRAFSMEIACRNRMWPNSMPTATFPHSCLCSLVDPETEPWLAFAEQGVTGASPKEPLVALMGPVEAQGQLYSYPVAAWNTRTCIKLY